MYLRTFLDLFLERTAQGNEERTQPLYTKEAEALYRKKLLSEIPPERQTEALRRKVAAKAIHAFLTEVLEEPDEDWGEAGKLEDIYECKVCANAIAQVCQKGILRPISAKEFGGNLPISEEEAAEAADRVCVRMRVSRS